MRERERERERCVVCVNLRRPSYIIVLVTFGVCDPSRLHVSRYAEAMAMYDSLNAEHSAKVYRLRDA